MSNKDWLNLTKQEFEATKVNMVVCKALKKSSEHSLSRNFPLPDWYPRTTMVPAVDHDVNDKVALGDDIENALGNGEHKNDEITEIEQAPRDSTSSKKDLSSFSI